MVMARLDWQIAGAGAAPPERKAVAVAYAPVPAFQQIATEP
jgi:hypothetical protein